METHDVVTLETHREFEKRMDDNIADIKAQMADHNRMAASVERLAASMEGMAKEQVRQGDDIREIRATVDSINVERIEITLQDHGQRIANHEDRIRALELQPQDSQDHENRIRALESKPGKNKDHEDRIRALEAKPAKNWERIVGGIIAGVVTFLIGMACANIWGG